MLRYPSVHLQSYILELYFGETVEWRV
jgi:hypothetical protein